MILNKIADSTIERVIKLKEAKSFQKVRDEAESLPINDCFVFEKALKDGDISFICEVKKASPSKGVISEDFPYLKIAKEYESGGASAISVLTEPYYFMGKDYFLTEIAQSVKIPVLRKDFTVDAYQIFEAKTLGASAVLLICSLLETSKLKDFIQIADSLGISALTEAHDEFEVESALKAGARVIGVNNRDLKTFTVDINNSLKLRSLVPDDKIFISESGIKTAEDINKLREASVNAVLIGETLMRCENKASAISILRGDIG